MSKILVGFRQRTYKNKDGVEKVCCDFYTSEEIPKENGSGVMTSQDIYWGSLDELKEKVPVLGELKIGNTIQILKEGDQKFLTWALIKCEPAKK